MAKFRVTRPVIVTTTDIWEADIRRRNLRQT